MPFDPTTPRWNSVYYNLLVDDAKTYKRPTYEALHKNATEKLGELGQNFFYMKKDSTESFLRRMANIEAQKELMLLKTYFNYNGKFESKEDVKNLTAAIQRLFHFKEISDRNADMILARAEELKTRGTNVEEGEEGSLRSKGVFSYFSGYFDSAFKKYSGTFMSTIISKMKDNAELTAGEATTQALEELLPAILDMAFENMFVNARLEKDHKTTTDKFNEAYKEIFEAWKRERNLKNPFVQQLFDSHEFNELFNELKEYSEENVYKGKRGARKWNKGDKKVQAAISSIVDKACEKNFYSRQGYSLEALEGYALYLLQQEFETSKTLQRRVMTAGLTGADFVVYMNKGKVNARPDNAFTFGIDPSDMEKAYAEATTSVDEKEKRLKAVKAFSKMSDKLKKYTNKSFVVYFNDKNYDIFKSGGHRGGSVKFGEIESLLKETRKIVARGGLHKLIYNTINSIPGAVGEKNREAVSSVLAQLVAFILFDDYRSIGSINIKGGGNAIHIFNLEGIMIPLSAFLFAMADAFEQLEQNLEAKQQVRVTISGPDILFPKGSRIPDDRAKNPEDKDKTRGSRFGGQKYWEQQRQDALDKGTVTWTFGTNFVDFLKSYVVQNTP